MTSARRPYLGIKQGIIDLFREPVRFLKSSRTSESRFEKPYIENEYTKMHLKIPRSSLSLWDYNYSIGGTKKITCAVDPACNEAIECVASGFGFGTNGYGRFLEPEVLEGEVVKWELSGDFGEEIRIWIDPLKAKNVIKLYFELELGGETLEELIDLTCQIDVPDHSLVAHYKCDSYPDIRILEASNTILDLYEYDLPYSPYSGISVETGAVGNSIKRADPTTIGFIEWQSAAVISTTNFVNELTLAGYLKGDGPGLVYLTSCGAMILFVAGHTMKIDYYDSPVNPNTAHIYLSVNLVSGVCEEDIYFTTVNPRVFNHWAITFKEGTLVVYLNKANVFSDTYNTEVDWGTGLAYVSFQAESDPLGVISWWDDLKFFNYALSAAEIGALP